jgi:hypothetical protein
MRQLAILVLVALGVGVLGCGHTILPPTIRTSTSGLWEAQLTGGKGPVTSLGFIVGFNVLNTNGGTTEALTITNFSFYNGQAQACIGAVDVIGSADLTTTSENQVTGSMSLTITSHLPAGNTLLLSTNNANNQQVGSVYGSANNGALTNGIVTGDWTLTSTDTNSDCQGNGTFLMCQGTDTCSAP